MKRGPKVTVIGAGSFFFGREIIHTFATRELLAGGTLALVDTRPEVLDTMMRLARRVFEATGCGVNVLGATDRREVMADSDFVVLSFSERNMHFRKLDTEIAARHGMRMCSSDSIGPGGIFRALREVPVALAVAEDVERLAPGAWVVNMVNPANVLAIALRRYAPGVRSFSLCDGHHEPRRTVWWLRKVGILPDDDAAPAAGTGRQVPGTQDDGLDREISPGRGDNVVTPDMWEKLDLAIGGVNHFVWMLRFNYDGRDMFPAVRRWIDAETEKEKSDPGDWCKKRFNAHYMKVLFDIYGVCPCHIGHTKEYVPFFQGHGVKSVLPEPLWTFDADRRAADMAATWQETEQYAAGDLTVDRFLRNVNRKGEHASDVMESMWGGLGKRFYIIGDNRGAAANMADDAMLELRSDVDMEGPRPLPFGAFPRGVLAMQQQALDTHELTAEAAVTGDRAVLRRAMVTDPLCVNIGDGDECIAELLEAQRDILPGYWYDGHTGSASGESG